MKVQAAVLSGEEVAKLSEALVLLTEFNKLNHNTFFDGKNKVDEAYKLLQEVLHP